MEIHILYIQITKQQCSPKQQLQYSVQVSITNNDSYCSTGIPDLIINANNFHLEIQTVSTMVYHSYFKIN